MCVQERTRYTRMYHDFRHCVWLTLGDAGAEHPWNQHMEHVPAHVTVRAYLDSAGDAREVARAAARRMPAGGAPVRLVGRLAQSHVDGFYALEHPVAWDGEEAPPAWWPENAHISFGYRYAAPFGQEEIEEARARVARGPQSHVLKDLRVVLCRGHFAGWTRA